VSITRNVDSDVVGVGGHITDSGARMDEYAAPGGVPVRPIEHGATVFDAFRAALSEPSWEVELGRMLPLRMDPDLADRLRLKRVHGIGQHDGAFEEMPVRLVRWTTCSRRAFQDQVIERHHPDPQRLRTGPTRQTIGNEANLSR
jgi:hypothetical protein